MSQKNIYIILIIAGAIVIIGGLLWYFLSGTEITILPTDNGFNVNGTSNSSGNIKGLSQGPIVSAHKSGDTILFYDLLGQLWQIKKDSGVAEKTEQQPAPNASEIVWSKNLKNIVKTGLEQSDIQHLFSDFTTKTLSSLKANIKSLAFSPDVKKIAYVVSDNKATNSLFTSDPDGKNQKTLIGNLKLRDVVLEWPKTNQISAVSRPSGTTLGNLWVLNTGTGGISKLIDGLFGLEVLWSPDGESFIYSYTDQNGQNPKLALYNKKGVTKTFGNIQTIVDKCSWLDDSLNIYCAVPGNWPAEAVLPDDYYKKAFTTQDEIWKINVETESKDIIASKLGNINNLIIDEAQDFLMFVSRSNQILYQLKGIK